ncbi:hypothetical protein pb186bvf_005488 [Paramecium bursaria]
MKKTHPTFQSQIFQPQAGKYFLGSKKRCILPQQQIKELLSTSCGEIEKIKPKPVYDVRQEFITGKQVAIKNKVGLLQSNIFYNQNVHNRNVQNAGAIAAKKKQLNKSAIYNQPKNTYGFLKKEQCTENKLKSQLQSQVFGNLDKYYTHHEPAKEKPHFMHADIHFLAHDSIRDKGLEREEAKYQNTFFSTPRISNQQINLEKSKSVHEISDKTSVKTHSTSSSISTQSYEFRIVNRSVAFDIKYLKNYCKHNGFEFVGDDKQFLLTPLKKDANLHEVVKYLKQHQNEVVIKKIKKSVDLNKSAIN